MTDETQDFPAPEEVEERRKQHEREEEEKQARREAEAQKLQREIDERNRRALNPDDDDFGVPEGHIPTLIDAKPEDQEIDSSEVNNTDENVHNDDPEREFAPRDGDLDLE